MGSDLEMLASFFIRQQASVARPERETLAFPDRNPLEEPPQVQLDNRRTATSSPQQRADGTWAASVIIRWMGHVRRFTHSKVFTSFMEADLNSKMFGYRLLHELPNS